MKKGVYYEKIFIWTTDYLYNFMHSATLICINGIRKKHDGR